MVGKRETDKFLINEKIKSSLESQNFYPKWWNQYYPSQHLITGVIESYHFHVLVILLVVADTSLVISEITLDAFKIHYECQAHTHNSSNHHRKMMTEHFEIAMEIAHYTSIAILIFFVIEIMVKIYAFGREFWNIRRRKMEYFDAFVVISSLAIDLYFLQGETKILGEKLLLILSFRLWRFVRIISSVTEATLHGQSKHKQNLNQQYLNAIHRLVDLVTHKTSYVENNKQDLDLILKHFRMIDDQAQSSLNALCNNHELTSSMVAAQFVEDLNGLENRNNDSVIAAMFAKPSDV